MESSTFTWLAERGYTTSLHCNRALVVLRSGSKPIHVDSFCTTL